MIYLNKHKNKQKNTKFDLEIQKELLELFKDKYKNVDLKKYCKEKNLNRKRISVFLKKNNRNCVIVHSKEFKDKIRIKRFEYLKKRIGNTAWEKRSKQIPSVLEQWFIDEVILKFELNKKYDIISEYAEFPYFIDFAFLNIKLAVELDGPTHFSHGNVRFEHDLKKDNYLLSKGWKIVRIAYNEKNKEKIDEFLMLLDDLTKYVYIPKILENHLYKNKKFREDNVDKKKLEIKRRLLLNKLVQLKKIKIIESSSIDFSKFGWVAKVAQLLEIKSQKVNKWMKKYMLDFYKTKCFKRNLIYNTTCLNTLEVEDKGD